MKRYFEMQRSDKYLFKYLWIDLINHTLYEMKNENRKIMHHFNTNLSAADFFYYPVIFYTDDVNGPINNEL